MGFAYTYSLPHLFLYVAEELHKKVKQAIQDFSKTKYQLIIQQKSIGISLYKFQQETVEQIEEAIKEFTGTYLLTFSD